MDEKLSEWVKGSPGVQHLPTNVGSRIRKRVYDALEKNPPDWARNRLEDSISKGVYKGDAAGPTMRGADQLKMDEKLPEWVKELADVRHLPTNVGSRIRKRVHDALEKNPPDWARKRLEKSVSKAVYKGNAAGPTKNFPSKLRGQWRKIGSAISKPRPRSLIYFERTFLLIYVLMSLYLHKRVSTVTTTATNSCETHMGAVGNLDRAVLSVLDDVVGKHMNEKPQVEMTEYHSFSVPDITMKLCRVVLRRTASLFDKFCKDFPKCLMDSSLDYSEGICDSSISASIFHHFDFRAIDCRLAVKTYKAPHEAFFQDVQELWDKVRTSHTGGAYMVQVADVFSQLFELAYEMEVVDIVRRLNEYSESNSVSTAGSREADNLLHSVAEIDIPGAPWNSGICKVCGINKDDNLVLLCDICDGEYHAYCLEPPLDKVPEEEWYCPSCISPEALAKNAPHISETKEQLEEESEASEDQLQYVTCEVCGDRGSDHDMLCCHNCEIAFVHRLCSPRQTQISVEDVKCIS